LILHLLYFFAKPISYHFYDAHENCQLYNLNQDDADAEDPERRKIEETWQQGLIIDRAVEVGDVNVDGPDNIDSQEGEQQPQELPESRR
jgi:hypothetical protein